MVKTVIYYVGNTGEFTKDVMFSSKNILSWLKNKTKHRVFPICQKTGVESV